MDPGKIPGISERDREGNAKRLPLEGFVTTGFERRNFERKRREVTREIKAIGKLKSGRRQKASARAVLEIWN